MFSVFLLSLIFLNDNGDFVIRTDVFDTKLECEQAMPEFLGALNENDLQTVSITCTERKIASLS